MKIKAIYIHDKDHFLSIINDEKLPYCVDVATLDKLIVLKGDKSKYRYAYYLYANISDNVLDRGGYYFHKSGLKFILRRHLEEPIMVEREDQIRRSSDSLFRFFEAIGYLDSNLRLFRNEERNFFLERAKKLLEDDSIRDYISYYGFRLIV